MQSIEAAPLAAIRATGADADGFLQGQLTQDLRKLVPGTPLLAGYCSAKGRLLAVFHLERDADGIVLRTHRSVADAVLKRLRMYVLRSKVTLERLPDSPAADENAWKLEQIKRGVPVIYAETSDQFVPQMVNLDHLGAISMDKGCYTGQEIVARLHYLGQLKRRMFLCRRSGAPVAPGTAVHVAGETQAAGMVVDSAQDASDSAMSVVLLLTHASSANLHLSGSPQTPLSVPQPYF